MTKYTADNHALPYPEGVDKVAAHSDVQALAVKTGIALTQEGARAEGAAYERARWDRTDVPLVSTADIWTLPPGKYRPVSNSAAITMGLPTENIGDLEITDIGASRLMTWTPVSSTPRFYINRRVGANWTGWDEFKPASEQGAASLEHDMRVTQFRSRYGGTYGTGGKAVVTLAFDHGTNNFISKVLPVLERLALPASLGLNSGMYDPAYIFAASDNQTTFTQIQTAALTSGIGILNHGRMHNAGGETEIVGGRNDLQAALPLIPIEGWMQSGAYGDFNSGGSFESYWKHPIGQVILNAHAYAMGNIQEPIKALSGDMMPGFDGQWLDNGASPIATVKSLIAEAQKVGGGVMTRMHPMYLDTSGYITTAQLTEFLEWVAVERDAGRLMVLTAAGLNLADSSSSERRNLLPGTFRAGDGWAGTGWTLTNGIFTTSGSSPLAREVNVKTHNAARGSTNEFHTLVRATASTVVRLTVTGTGINTSRNVTIPANKWVEVRNYFTIPLAGADALTMQISRVSGGALSLQQANIYPA